MAGTLIVSGMRLWTDTANPGASEPYVLLGDLWENTTTGNIYYCNNPASGFQTWLPYSMLSGALTQYGLAVGDANNYITTLAAGTTGTVLSGTTGANPSFTATPSVTSITLNGGTALGAYLEQQAWTPVITGGTVAGTGTYTLQSGYYTRIGNMIFAQATVTWTAHTGTGDMTITSLPFTCRNSSNYNPEGLVNCINIPLPGGTSRTVIGTINNNTSTVLLETVVTNAANSPIQMNATGTIHLTITYLT